MRPLDGKPTRRGLRQASKGRSEGRRATRQAQTAYGRHQHQLDHEARWAAICAAMRAEQEVTL